MTYVPHSSRNQLDEILVLLEKLIVAQLVDDSAFSMEPKDSVTYSQEPTSGFYRELRLISFTSVSSK